MLKVSGQKDPVMLLLKELLSDNGRRRNEKFFAEGDELVKRAFDYGGQVQSVVLSDKYAANSACEPILERADFAGVQVYVSTEGLLAKILDAKPTPECLAIVERKVVALDEVLAGENPFVQMVEHGENADNLGMLLRSTDAAGVTGVVLAADTTDPFARRVVRGSRGAVFTVPLCIQNNAGSVIEAAKDRGLQVVATSANSDQCYTSVDFTKPTMIVVGNEHIGISDTVRDMADIVVRIPMLGRINSLNISVAASVVLYEAVRQRGK